MQQDHIALDIMDAESEAELVTFVNVSDTQSTGRDVAVRYQVGRRANVSRRDWIGIFRSKDRDAVLSQRQRSKSKGKSKEQSKALDSNSPCLAFQWASVTSSNKNRSHLRTTRFAADIYERLKHPSQVYTYCYISKSGETLGVSIEFKVTAPAVSSKNKKAKGKKASSDFTIINIDSDTEPTSKAMGASDDDWDFGSNTVKEDRSCFSDMSDITILSTSPSKEAFYKTHNTFLAAEKSLEDAFSSTSDGFVNVVSENDCQKKVDGEESNEVFNDTRSSPSSDFANESSQKLKGKKKKKKMKAMKKSSKSRDTIKENRQTHLVKTADTIESLELQTFTASNKPTIAQQLKIVNISDDNETENEESYSRKKNYEQLINKNQTNKKRNKFLIQEINDKETDVTDALKIHFNSAGILEKDDLNNCRYSKKTMSKKICNDVNKENKKDSDVSEVSQQSESFNIFSPRPVGGESKTNKDKCTTLGTSVLDFPQKNTQKLQKDNTKVDRENIVKEVENTKPESTLEPNVDSTRDESSCNRKNQQAVKKMYDLPGKELKAVRQKYGQIPRSVSKKRKRALKKQRACNYSLVTPCRGTETSKEADTFWEQPASETTQITCETVNMESIRAATEEEFPRLPGSKDVQKVQQPSQWMPLMQRQAVENITESSQMNTTGKFEDRQQSLETDCPHSIPKDVLDIMETLPPAAPCRDGVSLVEWQRALVPLLAKGAIPHFKSKYKAKNSSKRLDLKRHKLRKVNFTPALLYKLIHGEINLDSVDPNGYKKTSEDNEKKKDSKPCLTNEEEVNLSSVKKMSSVPARMFESPLEVEQACWTSVKSYPKTLRSTLAIEDTGCSHDVSSQPTNDTSCDVTEAEKSDRSKVTTIVEKVETELFEECQAIINTDSSDKNAISKHLIKKMKKIKKDKENSRRKQLMAKARDLKTRLSFDEASSGDLSSEESSNVVEVFEFGTVLNNISGNTKRSEKAGTSDKSTRSKDDDLSWPNPKFLDSVANSIVKVQQWPVVKVTKTEAEMPKGAISLKENFECSFAIPLPDVPRNVEESSSSRFNDQTAILDHALMVSLEENRELRDSVKTLKQELASQKKQTKRAERKQLGGIMLKNSAVSKYAAKCRIKDNSEYAQLQAQVKAANRTMVSMENEINTLRIALSEEANNVTKLRARYIQVKTKLNNLKKSKLSKDKKHADTQFSDLRLFGVPLWQDHQLWSDLPCKKRRLSDPLQGELTSETRKRPSDSSVFDLELSTLNSSKSESLVTHTGSSTEQDLQPGTMSPGSTTVKRWTRPSFLKDDRLCNYFTANEARDKRSEDPCCLSFNTSDPEASVYVAQPSPNIQQDSCFKLQRQSPFSISINRSKDNTETKNTRTQPKASFPTHKAAQTFESIGNEQNSFYLQSDPTILHSDPAPLPHDPFTFNYISNSGQCHHVQKTPEISTANEVYNNASHMCHHKEYLTRFNHQHSAHCHYSHANRCVGTCNVSPCQRKQVCNQASMPYHSCFQGLSSQNHTLSKMCPLSKGFNLDTESSTCNINKCQTLFEKSKEQTFSNASHRQEHPCCTQKEISSTNGNIITFGCQNRNVPCPLDSTCAHCGVHCSPFFNPRRIEEQLAYHNHQR